MLVLAACGAAGVPAQAGPVFIAEQATGVVDPTGYSTVEITGLRGAASVRAGIPGDLRFGCRDLATRREERAVALWSRDGALILGPAQGREEERVLCEVIVPPSLSTVVALDDGKVVLSGLPGRNVVRGARVDLEARALAGSLDVEIAEGSVTARGVGDSLRLAGSALEVEVAEVQGSVTLVLEGGRARLSSVRGDVNVDLEGTELSVEGVDGQFEATASGGKLNLTMMRKGVTLHLSEAPLKLSASKGTFEIDTDAEMEARDLQGELSIRARRGQLAVLGLSGNLTVDAADCGLVTEKVSGTTRILGDALDLQLREVLGDLTVRTSSSQVVVAGASGTVSIENDFGDVVLAKAEKGVNITSSEGSVRVTQLGGPLQLRASGPDVTVHWTRASHGEDSSVENEGGSVTALFSGDGGGRVQAESRRGQVVSNIAGIEVDDDGRRAEGVVNRQIRPMITIVADGDVSLSSGVPGDGG